ncbi:phosphotransferase family protein [Nocardioides marmorisolisilvae]|uniref:Phosphotransferase family protein n=2 Tax=Nocardioides marmorisolisilvae TaxID=1542737 RepID=A0A3N0E0A6_9ACTN|nr:phosphotransferase family protein [Nocardioides marmorisolisilvae]
MTNEPPPADMTLTRSSRDDVAMAATLTTWLNGQLGEGADVEIALSGASDANGMSSETILADVTWTENGERGTHPFVMRMAPAEKDVPVFQTYRLDHQYEAIRLVGELSGVPVPTPRWLEATGEVLGQPFFFMDRIEGIVPPDVMPYTFGDNWFFDAPYADQRRLQDSTVGVLADLHSIPDARGTFGFLDIRDYEGDTELRRLFNKLRSWYTWAAAELAPSPLIDQALTWLEANWPEADRPDNVVLSWGDSRIGNCLYRDFEPVAVLDWEMAGIGPRELDLGWIVFAHKVFQSITDVFGMPGLPNVLKAEDVRAVYTEATGVEVGDLRWFEIYSAVIWGVVFMRTGARQVHFGELAEIPEDIDSLFHHGPLMRTLLEGDQA